MSNTANLELPLVMASQAQKHVTVNNALARLDAAVQMTLNSLSVTVPPASAVEGAVYAVPVGASGDWAGEIGKLAVFSNGGWDFVAPKRGWRGWVADAGQAVLHDGMGWVPHAVAVSANGAASLFEVIEIDVPISAGASLTTADVIPARSVVFGVTGIVTTTLTGTVGTWKLGVPGGSGQYGSGLGASLGSWVEGLSGQPQAFYAPTPLLIEAESGTFAGGDIRLAVHIFRMQVPRV
ncbi:MAG: DUF2793 domain-containing protein [Rhodobacteraceae bacterium]|nr:DUF2793 domain-containing protein [Paracoccaceae bacterium]